MTHKSIEEYITYLVDNQVNINIIEFVKEINKIKYKIDITFIDEFTGEALHEPKVLLN
jgi:hypothetical protein